MSMSTTGIASQLTQNCAFMRVTAYVILMGILLTIAGIIIVIYTFSSIVGLWLASQIMAARASGVGIPEPLAEAPAHHIDLMLDYAKGWRRHAWSVSIIALFTTLIALAASSPLAFWSLGCAILIDTILFVTYPNIKVFLAKTEFRERLIDASQSVALLAAFALLLWIHLRAGEVLG